MANRDHSKSFARGPRISSAVVGKIMMVESLNDWKVDRCASLADRTGSPSRGIMKKEAEFGNRKLSG